MGQELNDGALLAKHAEHQGRHCWHLAGERFLTGLTLQHLGSQLLQCPYGTTNPNPVSPKRAYMCVCACPCWAAGRLYRQLAQRELQPASSSAFAHESYFVKLLIPTRLVVFAAFLQRWLSPAHGFPLEWEHLSRFHTCGEGLEITMQTSPKAQKPKGKY